MTFTVFFDTSAMIKLYHDEDGTEETLSIINTHNPIILISDLTKIEFISAFAKKVRTNEITKDDFQEIVLLFENDTKKYEIIEIDKGIKSLAVDLLKMIGCKRGLKSLDALQLASALTFSKIKYMLDLFVVSDKNLGKIAEEQGLQTMIVL